MIPKKSDHNCSAASKQRSTRANPSTSSAGHVPQGILWDSCRVAASADGATVARTSTHGSWAAHLYDNHRYYEPAQTVPTVAGVIEHDDSWLEPVLGVALVLAPWMMALAGWSM